MISSWGCELEFGDVNRSLQIPENLGTWNYKEKDIVNQKHPYWGIACDPDGINPPVGGEINTVPTKTWKEQIHIIQELITFFQNNGCMPTVSCVSNTHIHVGLIDYNLFIERILDYTIRNQKYFVDTVYDHQFDPRMEETKTAMEYLFYDSGRLIEPQKIELLKNTKNKLKYLINKKIRYNRYAINLHSLIDHGTIEFRCFRSSLDLEELENCFKACELFMALALIKGPSLDTMQTIEKLKFPKLNYDHELYMSWEETRKENLPQVS